MRRLSAALLIVSGTLSTGSGGPGHAAVAEAVAFDLGDHGGILIPVDIGGSPLTFLLDTGAARSVVTDEVVARLALPVVARSEVVTASGTVMKPVVRMPSLIVGALRATDIMATVLERRALEQLVSGIDGVLAQDVLGDRNYMLDYRKRLLRWDEPDDERGGERDGGELPLRRTEGRYLVGLREGPAQALLWLVPDSAAQSIVLYVRADRAPPWTEPMRAPAILSGVGGSRLGSLVRLPYLRAGPVVFRNLVAVAILRDEASAPEGDGLLPLHLFASVAFDARRMTMRVEPR